MEYETADGSQFSLREVFVDDAHGISCFDHTIATAVIDGKPYACRFERRADQVDDFEIAERLETVPLENVYPPVSKSLTEAPAYDRANHYLKAPSFSYDACQHGNTFVADNFLAEARVLERLMENPHPNIVKYHGYLSRHDRIINLCLQRLSSSLSDLVATTDLTETQIDSVITEIEAGIKHLHSLGLAHNDINPYNICVDQFGGMKAVIIDFDSCLPIGEPLMKGVSVSQTGARPLSSIENDYRAIERVKDYLFDHCIS